MGAATALLHADRDPGLACMLLDSPFMSLRAVISHLTQGDGIFAVPSFLLEGAIAVVRMRIKTLANFDIEDLVPLDHAKKASIPALFVHGREDDFIPPSHSKGLFDAYAGDDKRLMMVDGD